MDGEGAVKWRGESSWCSRRRALPALVVLVGGGISEMGDSSTAAEVCLGVMDWVDGGGDMY